MDLFSGIKFLHMSAQEGARLNPLSLGSAHLARQINPEGGVVNGSDFRLQG